MDNTLFKEEWLSIKSNNGYTYLHEERSNGILISVLPYRYTGIHHGRKEYLMRMEVCPAHGNDHEFCGIIGSYDDTSITLEDTAVKEVQEETGYIITKDRIKYVDWVWDSKVADTKVYLYMVDLTGLPEGVPTTDGTDLERFSYCKWVEHERLLETKDSKILSILSLIR